MTGIVVSVSCASAHNFGKESRPGIRLLAGLGVEGDAHMGVTVKHRSRVAQDPAQPNLRQIHLIHEELLDELRAAGFDVTLGGMGEIVTTSGIDLLNLPRGARLRLGETAIIKVTGLRNPCLQLNSYRPGLMAEVCQIPRPNGERVAAKRSGEGVFPVSPIFTNSEKPPFRGPLTPTLSPLGRGSKLILH